MDILYKRVILNFDFGFGDETRSGNSTEDEKWVHVFVKKGLACKEE